MRVLHGMPTKPNILSLISRSCRIQRHRFFGCLPGRSDPCERRGGRPVIGPGTVSGGLMREEEPRSELLLRDAAHRPHILSLHLPLYLSLTHFLSLLVRPPPETGAVSGDLGGSKYA